MGDQQVTSLDPMYCYSVKELAFVWNVSGETIRRLFEEEPGVLVFEAHNRNRRRRRYRTLRIPGCVALRVQERVTVACT